jgi:hypothetical protein
MTKTEHVLFEFAHPCLKAVDHFDDLSDAIDYASVNLRARHHIKLHKPIRVNDFVVSAIDIPDDLDSMSFGVHLKGVAAYLLNKTDFPYKDYRIGTRLLYYMRYEGVC